MLARKPWIPAITVAVLLVSSPCRADDPWYTALEEARARAVDESKDLFIHFSGLDWCRPSKKMLEEVLSKEAFLSAASRCFVLVMLDRPHDISLQSEADRVVLRSLNARYSLTGVPTSILADAEGRPYYRDVGYSGTSVEEFTRDVMQKRQLRITRDEKLAQALKVGGLGRARLLDAAITGLDCDLVLDEYREIVDQILVLDVRNEAGLKAKYEEMLVISETREEIFELRYAKVYLEGLEQAALIDALIARRGLCGEPLQLALFHKAMCLQSEGERRRVRGILLEARAAAPDSTLGGQIAELLAGRWAEVARPEDGSDPVKKPSLAPKRPEGP